MLLLPLLNRTVKTPWGNIPTSTAHSNCLEAKRIEVDSSSIPGTSRRHRQARTLAALSGNTGLRR